MNTKLKIIEALDCALDDISEARLLDILLDAYKAKKRRIEELEGENLSERERMAADRESMREKYRRLRSDPLYCVAGEFIFVREDRQFRVRIQGAAIEMFERVGSVDYAMLRVK